MINANCYECKNKSHFQPKEEKKEKELSYYTYTIPNEDIDIIMNELAEYINPEYNNQIRTIIEIHSVFKEFISVKKTRIKEIFGLLEGIVIPYNIVLKINEFLKELKIK